jgi:o-succinylbenzoate synthase
MNASFKKHTLHFTFNAGTSRGVLKEKNTWYIFLEKDGTVGVGEAGPLPKLSIDDVPNFEKVLENLCMEIESVKAYEEIQELVPEHFPSVIFGLQTAWKDLENGGQKLIFKNDFTARNSAIPINGLVWMNDADRMIQQAEDKLKSGYTCIKFKIGAIDFEEEKSVLRHLRNLSKSVVIRLDANGAWTHEEALVKLSELQQFNIHSIEQPIKPNQRALMADLAQKRIIDIALDEELIGITTIEEKKELLREIKPQYIILKPTLLGGFTHCDEWIHLAETLKMGWWNTSALESNIGLNAICQYSYEKNPNILHGLGTGMLYSNNIHSPLKVANGSISYLKDVSWDTFE